MQPNDQEIKRILAETEAHLKKSLASLAASDAPSPLLTFYTSVLEELNKLKLCHQMFSEAEGDETKSKALAKLMIDMLRQDKTNRTSHSN